jgi:hypothetical protein
MKKKRLKAIRNVLREKFILVKKKILIQGKTKFMMKMESKSNSTKRLIETSISLNNHN